MNIALTMRALTHILDPFNIDDESDYKEFDKDDLDDADFRSKAMRNILDSEFCKPLLLDLRRVADTNQKVLAEMFDCKDALELLKDESAKRSYVLECIPNIARWRKETRAGNAAIVTSPFAKVVDRYAAEILNCDFCSRDQTEEKWFEYACKGEEFFQEVLLKGKLQERSPTWENSLEYCRGVKPQLTSKMSVGNLHGKLETYNVRETFAHQERLQNLLQVLALAVSTTAADDLKELENPATNLLKEAVVFIMERLSFKDTPLLEEGIQAVEKLVRFLPKAKQAPYLEVSQRNISHPLLRGVSGFGRRWRLYRPRGMDSRAGGSSGRLIRIPNCITFYGGMQAGLMLQSFATHSTRFRPYFNKERKERVQEDVNQDALGALYGFQQELDKFCSKDEAFPYDIPVQVAYVSKSLYGNIVDDVNEHLKNMEAFLENMLNAPYHPNASIPLREIGECFWGYRDGRKGH